MKSDQSIFQSTKDCAYAYKSVQFFNPLHLMFIFQLLGKVGFLWVLSLWHWCCIK